MARDHLAGFAINIAGGNARSKMPTVITQEPSTASLNN
jgi:hypothetical protein